MKVKRWERYKSEGRKVSTNAKGLSRFTWNTAGLQKRIKQLEEIAKRPAKG